MANSPSNPRQPWWQWLLMWLAAQFRTVATSEPVQAVGSEMLGTFTRYFGNADFDAARAQRVAIQLNRTLTNAIVVCRTELAALKGVRGMRRRHNPVFCQLSRRKLDALDAGLSAILAELVPNMVAPGRLGGPAGALITPTTASNASQQLAALLKGQSQPEAIRRLYRYALLGAINIQRKLGDGRDTNPLAVAGAVAELAALEEELRSALAQI